MLALIMVLSLACTAFATEETKYSAGRNIKVKFNNEEVDVDFVGVNNLDNIIFYAKAKPGYRITSMTAEYDGILTDDERAIHYDPLLGRFYIITPTLWWLYRDYTITIESAEVVRPLGDHNHWYKYGNDAGHTVLTATCVNKLPMVSPCDLGDGWVASLTVTATDGTVGEEYNGASFIEDENWNNNSELTHTDIYYFSYTDVNDKDHWTPLGTTAPTEAGKYAAVVFAGNRWSLGWAQAFFEIKEIPEYTLTITNANDDGYANVKAYDGEEELTITDYTVTVQEGKTVKVVYTTPEGKMFVYPTGKEFYDFGTRYEEVLMDDNKTVQTPAVRNIPDPPKPVEPEKPAHNTVVIEIGKKAEENGENNPDTGAPSMNLAAVAVVLGAAVVVSKKH